MMLCFLCPLSFCYLLLHLSFLLLCWFGKCSASFQNLCGLKVQHPQNHMCPKLHIVSLTGSCVEWLAARCYSVHISPVTGPCGGLSLFLHLPSLSPVPYFFGICECPTLPSEAWPYCRFGAPFLLLDSSSSSDAPVCFLILSMWGGTMSLISAPSDERWEHVHSLVESLKEHMASIWT